MQITPFDLAQRYAGQIFERAGDQDHPFIQWCFSLCAGYGLDTPDEVPWCSAFLQHPCWELRLPRSKSAAARSWLGIGTTVNLICARVGYDVVVLKRGDSPTAGHVGFFAGLDPDHVRLLGGNQHNGVSIAPFDRLDVIGVRRLWEGS